VSSPRITVHGPTTGEAPGIGSRARYAEILTDEALAFVADLAARFDARRRELLARREEVQAEIDGGLSPDQVAALVAGDLPEAADPAWRVADTPADLQDRRVEITGPVGRKMVINGLNSGARVFMADLEDATAPTWDNLVDGQADRKDA